MHMDQIWQNGFVCSNCLVAKNVARRENKLTAQRLSNTKLSDHIENRVNNFLKDKKVDAGEILIRVVTCSNNIFKVKPEMKKKFMEFPKAFPYRAKAIFAFQKTDDVDLSFFGMYVQEYGSQCPLPNTRCVYIAYLDSVHFFQPKEYRSEIYNEIMLGYLQYCKKLGFAKAQVWVCAPNQGEDYIFHIHPPEQKFLKQNDLIEWYKKLLNKGYEEGTVLEYEDKFQNQKYNGSITEMPYFDGDLWPNVLEESLKGLAKQEKKEKAALKEVAIEVGPGGEEQQEIQEDIYDSSKEDENNNHTDHINNNLSPVDDFLSSKINSILAQYNEGFYVITLHSDSSIQSLPPTFDPDPLIQCEQLGSRIESLNMAINKRYEFSSLRRSKFSTMAMLYEWHNRIYTCSNCNANFKTGSYCPPCNFYICENCNNPNDISPKLKLGLNVISLTMNDQSYCSMLNYQNDSVQIDQTDKLMQNSENVESTQNIWEDDLEKMEKHHDVSIWNENDYSAQNNESLLYDKLIYYQNDNYMHNNQNNNPHESYNITIEGWIQSLVHACQCKDENCEDLKCKKMKRIVRHTITCKSKIHSDCQICKQLIVLCCYHARRCQQHKCPAPFCLFIKQKLNKQMLQGIDIMQQGLGTTANLSQQQKNIALQQLWKTLDTPKSPEEQAALLKTLKCHSLILAAALKLREQQLQQNTMHQINQQQKNITQQQLYKTMDTPKSPEEQAGMLKTLKCHSQALAVALKLREQKLQQNMMDQSNQQLFHIPPTPIYLIQSQCLNSVSNNLTQQSSAHYFQPQMKQQKYEQGQVIVQYTTQSVDEQQNINSSTQQIKHKPQPNTPKTCTISTPGQQLLLENMSSTGIHLEHLPHQNDSIFNQNYTNLNDMYPQISVLQGNKTLLNNMNNNLDPEWESSAKELEDFLENFSLKD